jgi:hypothetical protein
MKLTSPDDEKAFFTIIGEARATAAVAVPFKTVRRVSLVIRHPPEVSQRQSAAIFPNGCFDGLGVPELIRAFSRRSMKDGRRDGPSVGTPELFLLQTSITRPWGVATSFTAVSRNCYKSGVKRAGPSVLLPKV